MQGEYFRIWPYVFAVLAVSLIYRRFRRSFGRQRINPIRMRLRIVLLIVLAGALLPLALKSGRFLVMESAGLVTGMALGAWGARHTRYQSHDGASYYVPHTSIGVAVSLLFVGRLVYRMIALYSMDRTAGPMGAAPAGGSFTAPMMASSPFTVGLLFTVVGYHVFYYGKVLWEYKRIRLQAASIP